MRLSSLPALAATLVCGAALADGTADNMQGHHHNPNLGHQKPPPVAVLQLDEVRDATSRFLDVDQATREGYVDIGLFIPHMGWHYMKDKLVDDKFEPNKPELLVYADDPCGGKRHLVAVEYAVPLSLSKKAPQGFFGHADEWDANQTFQLWTLHAWVFDFNPDGVFSPFNPREP